MKNLKTYLMILLACFMVITVVACGGSDEGDVTTTAPGGQDTSLPESNETIPEGDPTKDPWVEDMEVWTKSP